MIRHLRADAALERTGGDRAAARDLIRSGMMAIAEEEAAEAGRTIKCRLGRHASEHYGCANDGSTCICDCHDEATA